VIGRRALVLAPAAGRMAGLAAGLAALALPAAASSHDPGLALRLAGSQRTLSQRIAKAWMSQGDAQAGARAVQVLAGGQARFEQQLTQLLALAPTAEIAGSTRALARRWEDYRDALAAPADSREARAAVVARAGEVLGLARIGMEQWSGQARESSAAVSAGVGLVNLCGQQRWLSQRFAVLALAEPEAAFRRERSALVNEFEVTLEVLAQARETREAVRQTLAVARVYWSALKDVAGARDAAGVFSTSEGLLAVLDSATSQLAARLL
jgi:hypothetical protein